MKVNALKQFLAALNNPFGMKLSGNELLVLLRINNEMNTAHWTETLPLADSSLLALLNQYDSTGKPMSLESLRRIKQKLKGKGLIDFSSGKGSQISEYRLVKLYNESEPCRHPDNTPDDTPADTPDELLAEEYYSKTNLSENVKMENIKNKKNAHTRVFNKSKGYIEYFSLELDVELVEEWENDYICDDLTPHDLKILSGLQKKYGVEKLKTAMKQAYHKYGRYTKIGAIQDYLEKPKGAEKRDDTSEYAGLWGDDDSDDTNEYANLW